LRQVAGGSLQPLKDELAQKQIQAVWLSNKLSD
jgi:hypothetical protein